MKVLTDETIGIIVSFVRENPFADDFKVSDDGQTITLLVDGEEYKEYSLKFILTGED